MIAWARYPYEGRVVLVTGAGSGIGRAIARAFLEQGSTVAVCGRRPEPLYETVAGFPEERVAVLEGDMSDAGDIERAVEQVSERHGRIDVVVANAGLSLPGPADRLDDETMGAHALDQHRRAHPPDQDGRAAPSRERRQPHRD